MTPTPTQSIEYRLVSALVPSARNARTHTARQVAQIKALIAEYGWTNPVLADGEGIVAGHGRVLAAAELYAGGAEIRLPSGETLPAGTVPVLDCTGWSSAQRRAYVIADNAAALGAGWDADLLLQELSELKLEGFDLGLTGFAPEELDKLLDAGIEPEADDAAANVIPEPPDNPATQPGDVWALGPHRLICGDCREAGTLDALLAGTPVNLAFTSPPYAEQREYDATSGFVPIAPDAYVEWFAPVAANVQRVLAPDGSWFVNIKPASDGLDTLLYVFDLVLAHARRWGWHFATELCWERVGMPKLVTQRFKNQFEPIYQFTLGRWKMRPDAVRHASDNVPIPFGPGAGRTSWATRQGGDVSLFGPVKRNLPNGTNQRMSGVQGTGEHLGNECAGLAYPGNRLPTFAGSHEATGHAAAFPVGLPEFFCKAYTDAGDAVLDPFLGSGSTLIAAHRSGRIGYGCEVSPAYCDVAIVRWQNLTGEHAVRVRDGLTYEAVREDMNPAKGRTRKAPTVQSPAA